MNPFNKFEAVGILISIALMVLALGVIRFKTDIVATADSLTGATQSAVVAVAPNDVASIEDKLTEASSVGGTLLQLVVDDIKVGTGDAVRIGDTVTVHYIGRTQDGVTFDSSYKRGEPFTFTVGEDRVIKGWEEGIVGMKVGGDRILVIPPHLAYGNRTVSIIPPNATLVFGITLLDIQ